MTDDDHIFPPEWGWEQYEPTFREWIAQHARINEVIKEGDFEEAERLTRHSDNWFSDQVEQGKMPDEEERLKDEDRYFKGLDRLFLQVYADMDEGRLTIGHDHLRASRAEMIAAHDHHAEENRKLFNPKPVLRHYSQEALRVQRHLPTAKPDRPRRHRMHR